MIRHLPYVKEAVSNKPEGERFKSMYIRYLAYRENYSRSNVWARAMAQKAWFEEFPTYIYEYDLVAGSLRGDYVVSPSARQKNRAEDAKNLFGSGDFWLNRDHFAPAYERFLNDGICGTMEKIRASRENHKDEPDRAEFLDAMAEVLEGFSTHIKNYAQEAEKVASETDKPECASQLRRLADDLNYISREKPVTLRQALNLVYIAHVAFHFQDKYAMALGRLDQYLYPFYKHDIEAGIITDEEAEDLFACAFIKLWEVRWLGRDDVVNICIGGTTPDGKDAVNELSYIILHAVRDCNIPGPNLSARLHDDVPDRFIDECLQVIGTGLGYPAMMNDKANIPALLRYGYSLEDARNHCFVGCIENFIPGKQPGWTDGRFNVPNCLEGVFYRGSATHSDYCGVDSGPLEDMKTMDDFMCAFKKQIDRSAAEYVTRFNNYNAKVNYAYFTNVFMSMLCDDCIGRGLDINCGGAVYPSVHGACAMGIATVADSLAAIEKLVFIDKEYTLMEIRDAMKANFDGYEELRQKMRNVCKYGNNDDFVDKYAVWFVEYLEKAFSPYRTRDNGAFYIGIASNVANIYCGAYTGATPDGRHAKEPMSDAASPTYGMDQNGPTSAFLSLSKPDYSLSALGTVVNQKYTTDMLRDPTKRAALAAAIKTYFKLGGQELQINCVSRETLIDAMEHPENYEDLVVRVSGFSAYYVSLGKDTQKDILSRTEHSKI
ncbi:MAG: hypothetical protein E7672_03820 [Ruminococcaceae bacterium]|nr:hypothetical protein [Oscillospiraceae bacterium]